MNTKYIPTAAVMMATILLSSCVASIELKTNDSPPVIIIYGCITDQPDYHTVRVSASSPYFDREPNRHISGAEVEITSSTGEIIRFHESDTDKGLYKTIEPAAGVSGKIYTLTVKADFNGNGIYEVYTASSAMLPAVKADSIKVSSTGKPGRNDYVVYLYAQDPPTVDFYLSKFLVNDSPVNGLISQYVLLKDATFNGQYLNGYPVQNFDNTDDSSGNTTPRLSKGDRIRIEFSHIGKDFYDFIYQCQEEMNGEKPLFGGPASNIITNISGTARGFFAAYTVTTAEATVED